MDNRASRSICGRRLIHAIKMGRANIS